MMSKLVRLKKKKRFKVDKPLFSGANFFFRFSKAFFFPSHFRFELFFSAFFFKFFSVFPNLFSSVSPINFFAIKLGFFFGSGIFFFFSEGSFFFFTGGGSRLRRLLFLQIFFFFGKNSKAILQKNRVTNKK